MATIRFEKATTAMPEQFIVALNDFGPGDWKLFRHSSECSNPHHVGAD
jgi:hypothetical protein